MLQDKVKRILVADSPEARQCSQPDPIRTAPERCAQGRDRTGKSQRPQRLGGRGGHVGIGILKSFAEHRQRARMPDPRQRIQGVLAKVLALVSQEPLEGRQGSGAKTDESLRARSRVRRDRLR